MQNLPFATQQEQVNKFLQANRVLGAQMDQMQGTSRVIYDTRPVGTSANQTINFFDGVAGRSSTAIDNQIVTNIQDNRFEPGEGMVIKEFGFYNTDTNATESTTPVNINTSIFGLSLLNFYIGNNRVIKDLPLFLAQTTMGANNLNTISSSTTNQINTRYTSLRLFTNIVIPPQIQFYATLLLPFGTATGAGRGISSLRLYVKGYGKLFNPRNNY